jgi:hypothetical protein
VNSKSHVARWRELPQSKWREGKQGRMAFQQGTTHGITCPECNARPIVYNGNYFCDGWGDDCDWALPHPAERKRDREICDLIGTDYE